MLDNVNTAAGRKKQLRCAIYTRKSHEEGLEQEFNSLDAQREASESYIESRRMQGWQGLPDRYDDGGFSGGNMERPALKRLLDDVDDGKSGCDRGVQNRPPFTFVARLHENGRAV